MKIDDSPGGEAGCEPFRESFRATVPASYSGLGHGARILGFGLAVIVAASVGLKAPLTALEIAVIMPVVVGWNLLEWYGHRALHRPGQGALARALYQRHTLTHHRFFTHESMALRDGRDLKIVFFPAFALPLLTLLALPGLLLLGLLWSANAALVALIALVAIYLIFETLHLCAHLPAGSRVARLPGIRGMCRHHRRHHDPRVMMDGNMNFTFPLADWLLGAHARRSSRTDAAGQDARPR
jgi:hypothetical protein